jgi:hypothetical protein
MVQHFTVYTAETNQSGRLGPTIEILHGGPCILTSLPPEPCDTSFTVNGNESHMSPTPTQPVQQDSEEDKPLLQEKDEVSVPLMKRTQQTINTM